MSPVTTWIAQGLFALVLAAAAWTDVRTRRIPNALTVGCLLGALVLRSFGGIGSLVDGLEGAGLAMAFVLPLFALGGFGGGDAKLLVAVGAFLGPSVFLRALAATAILGFVLSLYEVLRRRLLVWSIAGVRDLFHFCVTLGRRGARPSAEPGRAVAVPYGVAIAVGSVIGMLL